MKVDVIDAAFVTKIIRHPSVSAPGTADADIKTRKKLLKTRSGNEKTLDVIASDANIQ